MGTASDDYAAWVGRRELARDDLCLAPALAAAAMLDDTTTPIEAGSCLPPLWHWFYFLPRVPQARLGADGHPERGGFMPPIPYPRRMFAGAQLRFHRPLIVGRPATRESEIVSVSVKIGRSGPLAFVSVVHRFFQDDDLHVEEKQDIVYREPGPAVSAAAATAWAEPASGVRAHLVTPDPRLLFRFSALTFNAHRIHYDRPYAMAEEGYPGLVVHGPLTALLLCELARAEADQPIAEFGFRALAPLFDLAPFRLLCTPEEGGCVLEAQGPDGSAAMRASARFSASPTG